MPSRYQSYLHQRYRLITGYTGLMCLVTGLLIQTPLLLLVVFRQESIYLWHFLLPGAALVVPGALLWRRLIPAGNASLTWQEGAVIVVVSWLLATVVGAVPFMTISGLNFTQAIFEATSGWTTTGLSVVDVTEAPRLVLFYRSILQLAGGAGFAIIMVSALAGPTGISLSAAEGRTDQLLPHVRRSAQLVLIMYTAYNLAGIVGLMLAGMDWFDAVNHAFSALSTGGFSTRVESIGYWDSPLIEAVTIILMLLGALSFMTAYTLFQGNFKVAARNGEVRQQILVALGAIIILLAGVTWGVYPGPAKAIRVAIFEAVTAFSTAGFSTVGYQPWNGLGWLTLIILMIMGGGAGSTAGGIKQFRIYLLFRGLRWEVQRVFMSASAVNEPVIWQGENRLFLNSDHFSRAGLFVFLHLSILFVGTGILVAHGYSLPESLFEFASALSTVGLSVGVTAADAPGGILWAEIIGMFLGRLEFFVVFVGLTKLSMDLREMVGVSG